MAKKRNTHYEYFVGTQTKQTKLSKYAKDEKGEGNGGASTKNPN